MTTAGTLEPIPGGPADMGRALPGPPIKDLSGAGAAVEVLSRSRRRDGRLSCCKRLGQREDVHQKELGEGRDLFRLFLGKVVVDGRFHQVGSHEPSP